MNVVIVSYHFLPKADAESFCATRFASALANAGHDVQVITVDHPKTVSDDVYTALVSPRVKLVKLPLKAAKRGPIWSRLRFLTYEWEAVNFAECIRATKLALEGVEKPVLVSRTHPLGSLIIAWHCRKYADKWVAHLSDPLPWFYWNSFFGRLRYHFERKWIKRALRGANGISLTCEQARRFFHENYGELFDKVPCFVTTHIGDNALKAKRKPWTQKIGTRIVAHPGTLYAGRGADAIADAVKQLNEEGTPCTLAMVGGGSPDQVATLASRPHLIILNDYSPELSLSLTDAADVLYVSDFESSLLYSPRLMSKFVYQLFEDKPMVVRAPRDSSQHEYCVRFPNSGMFYADDTSQEALVSALRNALLCVPGSYDRSAIRKEFSAETIAAEFIVNAQRLGTQP